MRKAYQCEVCCNYYTIRNQAIKCESKGIFNADKFLVPGFMFPYFVGDKYFGIACVSTNGVHVNETNKHQGYIIYDLCKHQPGYEIVMHRGLELFDFTDDAIKNYKRTRKTNRIYLQEKEFLTLADKLKSDGISPYYLADNGRIIHL